MSNQNDVEKAEIKRVARALKSGCELAKFSGTDISPELILPNVEIILKSVEALSSSKEFTESDEKRNELIKSFNHYYTLNDAIKLADEWLKQYRKGKDKV